MSKIKHRKIAHIWKKTLIVVFEGYADYTNGWVKSLLLKSNLRKT